MCRAFWEFQRVFVKHFWIQVAVSLLKSPHFTKLYNGCIMCDGHSPTDKTARSSVTGGHVTTVAVGQRERLGSGVRISTWHCPSFFLSG
jgi:hypothetical protein